MEEEEEEVEARGLVGGDEKAVEDGVEVREDRVVAAVLLLCNGDEVSMGARLRTGTGKVSVEDVGEVENVPVVVDDDEPTTALVLMRCVTRRSGLLGRARRMAGGTGSARNDKLSQTARQTDRQRA